jgi:hypothetical protein
LASGIVGGFVPILRPQRVFFDSEAGLRLNPPTLPEKHNQENCPRTSLYNYKELRRRNMMGIV